MSENGQPSNNEVPAVNGGQPSTRWNPVTMRIIAISVSFVVGAILLGVKFYAYRLTGSTAVLSDALESIINVVAGAFALISVILAARPPDPDHPYGHGKIEHFSAGFEGALIILAALGIFGTAYEHWMSPRELPNLDTGLILLMSTAVVNLLVGGMLIVVGRRTSSAALVADGKHLQVDAFTTLGILVGLLAASQTGYHRLDPMLAVLVGVHILFSGGRLLGESFQALMDRSDPQLLDEISNIFATNRKSTWVDIHRLRAQRHGDRIHMEFHLVLPYYMTLLDAEVEVDTLIRLIRERFGPSVDVLIHTDPCDPEDCPICGTRTCEHRSAEHDRLVLWRRESTTANVESRKPEEES